MAVNLNMRGDSEGSINEYLSDTIGAVFQNVYTIDVPNYTNRALYAFDSGKAMVRFERGIAHQSEGEWKKLMQTIHENMSPYEPGSHIMTDDKAPVELLGMQIIDSLIRNEVAYYRKIYEEEGLQGLLSRL